MRGVNRRTVSHDGRYPYKLLAKPEEVSLVITSCPVVSVASVFPILVAIVRSSSS